VPNVWSCCKSAGARLSVSVAPSCASIAPSCASVAPGCASVAPSCDSVAPSCASVAPGCASVAPSCASVAPGCAGVTSCQAQPPPGSCHGAPWGCTPTRLVIATAQGCARACSRAGCACALSPAVPWLRRARCACLGARLLALVRTCLLATVQNVRV